MGRLDGKIAIIPGCPRGGQDSAKAELFADEGTAVAHT